MDPALDSHCDLGGMYTYSPASKCSSALPHQPSRSPRHDQYEISGLGHCYFIDYFPPTTTKTCSKSLKSTVGSMIACPSSSRS